MKLNHMLMNDLVIIRNSNFELGILTYIMMWNLIHINVKVMATYSTYPRIVIKYTQNDILQVIGHHTWKLGLYINLVSNVNHKLLQSTLFHHTHTTTKYVFPYLVCSKKNSKTLKFTHPIEDCKTCPKLITHHESIMRIIYANHQATYLTSNITYGLTWMLGLQPTT